MTMANGLTSADRKSWEILAGIVGEHYMNDTTGLSGIYFRRHPFT
jgi:hypothetical protein